VIQTFRMRSYSTRKSSDINPVHIDNNFTRWQRSLGIEISEKLLLIEFWYLHWLGCLSGIDQTYFLLALTYPLARCTFGYSLAIGWVSSSALRTRVANVNRCVALLNTLVVKILLVFRLRAVWNKDLIGERKLETCASGIYILIILDSSYTNSILHDGRYVL